MIAHRLSCLLLTLLFALPSSAENTSLQAHSSAIAEQLSARAQAVLERIPDVDRRLLAARAYLRSGRNVDDRWSWTQAQMDAYRDSPEQQQALAELERIRTRFAELNPGYTLHVNTDVRSLEVQLERWNSNPGVLRTAAQLQRAMLREVESGNYPTDPTPASTASFSKFLQSWSPSPPPPLAAPGLSRHGQARAFDFHIMQGDRIVAGTDMAAVKSVWDRHGWTNKLKAAVESASDRFSGPLAAPYEPWHYEYEASVQRKIAADAR